MRKISKEQRRFMKPNSISQCLKCSICMQPFHEPTRLFCGHTYCGDCIQQWGKAHGNCPICRTKIDSKEIGMDLLAFNFLNELAVFCIHDECPWKGELEMLSLHVNNECYHEELAQEGDHSKSKAKSVPAREVVDQEVEEKINENTVHGNLISRAMMRDSLQRCGKKIDVARKIIRAESHSVLPERKGKPKKQDKTVEEPKEEVKSPGDNFDFLMELYESK